jgi:hypothetical protein
VTDGDLVFTSSGWQAYCQGNLRTWIFAAPDGKYTPQLKQWDFPDQGDSRWLSQARLAVTFIEAVRDCALTQYIVLYDSASFALLAVERETMDSLPDVPPLWLTFALKRLRRMPRNVWERLVGRPIL